DAVESGAGEAVEGGAGEPGGTGRVADAGHHGPVAPVDAGHDDDPVRAPVVLAGERGEGREVPPEQASDPLDEGRPARVRRRGEVLARRVSPAAHRPGGILDGVT